MKARRAVREVWQLLLCMDLKLVQTVLWIEYKVYTSGVVVGGRG
jgi:hypothetical protein